MSELDDLCSEPPLAKPRRGVLITARNAGRQALGISAATAVMVLAPALASAAPALYAVIAVRLHRVRL